LGERERGEKRQHQNRTLDPNTQVLQRRRKATSQEHNFWAGNLGPLGRKNQGFGGAKGG